MTLPALITQPDDADAPIEPTLEEPIVILVAGSTNAHAHFTTASGIVPGRTSAVALRAIVAEGLALSLADVEVLDVAVADSVASRTSQESFDGVLYWWDADSASPGPLLEAAIAAMDGKVVAAIVWAEGEASARAITDPPPQAISQGGTQPDPTALRWLEATQGIFAAFRAADGDDTPIFVQGLGRIVTAGEEAASRARQDLMLLQLGRSADEPRTWFSADLDAKIIDDYGDDDLYRPDLYHEIVATLGDAIVRVLAPERAALIDEAGLADAPALDSEAFAAVLREPVDVVVAWRGGDDVDTQDDILISWSPPPANDYDEATDPLAIAADGAAVAASVDAVFAPQLYDVELLDGATVLASWTVVENGMVITMEMQAEISEDQFDEVTIRTRIADEAAPGPWTAVTVSLGTPPSGGSLTNEPVPSYVSWVYAGTTFWYAALVFEPGAGANTADTYEVEVLVDDVVKRTWTVAEVGSVVYVVKWTAAQMTADHGALATTVQWRVRGGAAATAPSSWAAITDSLGADDLLPPDPPT